MTTRQYVAVKFRQNDRRSYTYHNDAEPVAIGDKVKVPDRSGDGWSAADVVDVHEAKPDFATKAILGKVEPCQPDMLDAGDDADLDRERGA